MLCFVVNWVYKSSLIFNVRVFLRGPWDGWVSSKYIIIWFNDNEQWTFVGTVSNKSFIVKAILWSSCQKLKREGIGSYKLLNQREVWCVCQYNAFPRYKFNIMVLITERWFIFIIPQIFIIPTLLFTTILIDYLLIKHLFIISSFILLLNFRFFNYNRHSWLIYKVLELLNEYISFTYSFLVLFWEILALTF
jgi:hypothetical protein